jgi:hypothetical protein
MPKQLSGLLPFFLLVIHSIMNTASQRCLWRDPFFFSIMENDFHFEWSVPQS